MTMEYINGRRHPFQPRDEDFDECLVEGPDPKPHASVVIIGERLVWTLGQIYPAGSKLNIDIVVTAWCRLDGKSSGRMSK